MQNRPYRIWQRIPSRLELVPSFISMVTEKLKSLSIKEDDLFHIKLSLEEALVNAIRHGNKLNPDLSVEVDVEIDNNRLTIKVKDQGKGFDFNKLPDPTKAPNLQKTSGRGVFLIKKMMDEVEFFAGGRGIKMVKLFNKISEKAKEGEK